MDIKNWFDFPVHVFIDTQVYISESYKFNEIGNLYYFCKHVLDGKIIHLTSDVVIGEVEKHIKEDILKLIERFNSIVDDRKLSMFKEKGHNQLEKLNESEMVKEAISIFHEYLSDTKVFALNTETVDLKTILSDYFEVKPPFGFKKEKKSEFPDAFNLSMLRKYAEHNRPIIIVSGDRDFSDEENITCFKTLKELLSAINSQEEITKNVIKYLKRNRQYIFDEVETRLDENGYALDVDGTDTDRKGCQHGVEYDETELLSFVAKSLLNIGVVNIDLTDKVIIISLDCKADLEFSCIFIDEVFGDYAVYGRMEEAHNTLIPVTVSVSFENNDENVDFNIDDVAVDIKDIELNQYTLIEGSRERTNTPNPYWDDDEPVDNPCPDCGCEIKFETDGGNGFCINCAPNH